MGVPDDPEEFVQFEVDGLTVYVAQGLVEKLEPGEQQMFFHVGSYGRFWLTFAEPWIGDR
jgi:hypothetical protein